MSDFCILILNVDTENAWINTKTNLLPILKNYMTIYTGSIFRKGYIIFFTFMSFWWGEEDLPLIQYKCWENTLPTFDWSKQLFKKSLISRLGKSTIHYLHTYILFLRFWIWWRLKWQNALSNIFLNKSNFINVSNWKNLRALCISQFKKYFDIKIQNMKISTILYIFL